MNIFLTCGIGDFIAVESFLTKEEKESVEKVYWATRQWRSIQPLAPFCFPNLKEHEVVHDKFTGPHTKMFCFISLYDLERKTGKKILDPAIKDCSIYRIFTQVRRRQRKFCYSSLAINKVADISKFNLPFNYLVIHPQSDNMPTAARDFSDTEWIHILNMIQEKSLVAVVIDKGMRSIPEHQCLINLQNKTTVAESLEVVKRAYAFIGAASYPSVMAAKVINQKRILIKGDDSLKKMNFVNYYSPLRSNECVVNRITPTLIEYFSRSL